MYTFDPVLTVPHCPRLHQGRCNAYRSKGSTEKIWYRPVFKARSSS